jgi:hypothetical protein
MFCGALLGKSSLVEALFMNLSIDKIPKAVLNLVPRE